VVNHYYALEKIIAKDIDYIEKSLHKDFLSVQEYEMVSREEWLQQMKDWFADESIDLRNANIRILSDNEDIHTFQYETERDGQKIRRTNVTFFRDGKVYRHIGHDNTID